MLLSVVFFARPVYAEDVKLNILFLPNEAAECRYLDALSAKVTDVLTLTEHQRRKAQILYHQGKTEQAFKYFGALLRTLQDTVQVALGDISDGMQAEKMKRGTLPPCANHIEIAYEMQRDQYVRLSRSIHEQASKVSAEIEKGRRRKR